MAGRKVVKINMNVIDIKLHEEVKTKMRILSITNYNNCKLLEF